MNDNNQQNIDSGNQLKAQKRKHDKDFINQVIGVYKSGIYKSAAECARAYGIQENTLYTWLHKLKISQTPEALSSQATEITQLKKELARAKMELEILKKASIYFANLAR